MTPQEQKALELAIEMVQNKMYAHAEMYLKEALAQEKALQALHDENERIGLYKDAYEQQSNEQVEPTEVRLWDSQWINVVNHDNCYQGWDKEDAINHAVKMTEKYIASNFAENTHPPVPTAQPKPLDDAVLYLSSLVYALDNAFISSWQSTASWQIQLDEAKEYLTTHGIKE